MTEKVGQTVGMICWRGRLGGIKAIDIESQIQKGESCPKDRKMVNVLVNEGASESEELAAAANQFPQKCGLCGLAPTAADFTTDIYR